MRISVGFVIAVLAVCAATSAADEYQSPPMKDGLWETHTVRTVAGKNPS